MPPSAAAAAAAAAQSAAPLDLRLLLVASTPNSTSGVMRAEEDGGESGGVQMQRVRFSPPRSPPPAPPASPLRELRSERSLSSNLFSAMAGMHATPVLRRATSHDRGLAAPARPNSISVSVSTPDRRESGGWGGEEAAPGAQYQWALPQGDDAGGRSRNGAFAALAAAASKLHLPPPLPFSRAAGPASGVSPGAPLAPQSPFFAIVDDQVVTPPATRAPRHARLLGDESASIVSLLPAATETLSLLGDSVWRRVQGVSDLCPLPPAHPQRPPPRVVSRSNVDLRTLPAAEAARELRSLADRRLPAVSLDCAWLAAAAPAVVITQELCGAAGGDPRASAVHACLHRAALLGAGSPTAVLVVRPRTLCDALEAIEHVGCAVGAEAAALALLRSLRGRLRAVCSAVAGVARPRVLSLEGLRPLLAGGHWLPEMKALAGGRDELQEAGARAEALRWETVLSYDPDVLLLLPPNPGLEAGLEELAWLAAQPGFWALSCVRERRVYLLQHGWFSVPGPGLVSGVEALARVLHPERWAQRLPPGMAVKLALPPGERCRPHQVRRHFEPYE